jgi:sugar phosphate isomerase/epimerase
MSKLGVIHYNAPGKTLNEFLRWAADTGFEFLELMPPDVEIDNPTGTTSVEIAKSVKALVNSYGLRVSAFSARNDFVVLDSAVVEHQVARMRKVAEVVKILDDEAVIRSEGGWEKAGVPKERWGDAMFECFARCADFLDEIGVDLAIDNHGTITNDGTVLLPLLKRLEHPRIGSNLDTMNLRWFGNGVESCNNLYKELAPYVKHVHLKDGFGARSEYKGAALGDGEIDLPSALASLRAVGYAGVYAAEYEGPEIEGGVGYAKCLQWMKAHV